MTTVTMGPSDWSIVDCKQFEMSFNCLRLTLLPGGPGGPASPDGPGGP